jgi:general secretion pathway protein C
MGFMPAIRPIFPIVIFVSIALVALITLHHADALAALSDADPTPKELALPPSKRTSAPLPRPRAEAIVEALPPAPFHVQDFRNTAACQGVTVSVIANGAEERHSLATLSIHGKDILVRKGASFEGGLVVHIGNDRVWLVRGPTRETCQVRMFEAESPAQRDMVPTPGPSGTSLENEIARHIAKIGPTEFEVDRPTVERILEVQSELLRARIVPVKQDGRVVGMKIFGIKPGSVLALIGLENGDQLEMVNGYDVTQPEKVLEAYARLRVADRLTLQLARRGAKMTFDYAIRG